MVKSVYPEQGKNDCTDCNSKWTHVMSYLGIKPREQVELHLLPDSKVNINARPRKPFKDCIDLLAENVTGRV